MLAFTKNKKITLSYAILTVGMSDMQRAINSRVKTIVYCGISLYVVNEHFKVVVHDDIYFCSCGKSVCWHIYGVIWGDWVEWDSNGDKYFDI